MSKKLPPVSGNRLISLMKGLGYQIVRQRGSPVRLEKNTPVGTHKITAPNHDPIAKGTLSDILHNLSIWNQISKEDLEEAIDGWLEVMEYKRSFDPKQAVAVSA